MLPTVTDPNFSQSSLVASDCLFEPDRYGFDPVAHSISAEQSRKYFLEEPEFVTGFSFLPPEGTPSVLVCVPSYTKLGYATQTALSAYDSFPYGVVWVVIIDDCTPEKSFNYALEHYFRKLPYHYVSILRFPHRAGLTRSWNYAAILAQKFSIPFIVFGNSDLLFPKNWFLPIRKLLLEQVLHVCGPVTNAPGHRDHQLVVPYLEATSFHGFKNFTDDRQQIESIQSVLFSVHWSKGRLPPEAFPNDPVWYFLGPLSDPELGLPTFHRQPINGFCFVSTLEAVQKAAYDLKANYFFCPDFPLIRNEDSFLGQVKRASMTYGFTPASYVFHYRSITRGPSGLYGPNRKWHYRPPTPPS